MYFVLPVELTEFTHYISSNYVNMNILKLVSLTFIVYVKRIDPVNVSSGDLLQLTKKVCHKVTPYFIGSCCSVAFSKPSSDCVTADTSSASVLRRNKVGRSGTCQFESFAINLNKLYHSSVPAIF